MLGNFQRNPCLRTSVVQLWSTRKLNEILIKTKDIVQGLGFELLYADTASVFLKKDRGALEDFEYVKEILSREAVMTKKNIVNCC